MQLDPKGLEAARTAVADLCNTATEAVPMAHVEATVRAYLEAAPSPSPAPGVVEALEPFAWIGQWLFARDLPDDTAMVTIEGAGKPFNLTRGMFKAAHTALASLSQPAKEREGGE